MHTLPISDLKLFSTEEDLHQWQTAAQFPANVLEMQIEHNSHRAIVTSNASTQMMLAALEEDNSEQQLQRHEQAEQLAYNLGYQEFVSSGRLTNTTAQIDNPFSTRNLQQAWDNGFTRSAIENKRNHEKLLEKQLWGETIQNEQPQCQYAMAALALFDIAEHSNDSVETFRATQLANEMILYTEKYQPSPGRQQQIDQFLSMQASRLAEDLDF